MSEVPRNSSKLFFQHGFLQILSWPTFLIRFFIPRLPFDRITIETRLNSNVSAVSQITLQIHLSRNFFTACLTVLPVAHILLSLLAAVLAFS